jgi:hypothetical protein
MQIGRAAIVLGTIIGGAVICSQQSWAQEQPPSHRFTSIFTGSDAQHPGAGVASVEQAVVEGGAPRAAPVGRPRRCDVYAEPVGAAGRMDGISNDPGSGQAGGDTPVDGSSMVVGERYYVQCRYVDDGSLAYLSDFVHDPGVSPGPSAAAIARQVYEQVPLVFPQPHTSPPLGAPHLVGFPTWFWVDGTVWRSFDAHASLAGITVSVVAEPKSLHWDMGDGTSLTCAGPGTAWTADTPADQRSACSHVYQFVSAHQPDGRYHGQVTVVWSVSWSASTGESGGLPDASRSTSFTLDVGQRQAVVTYGGG